MHKITLELSDESLDCLKAAIKSRRNFIDNNNWPEELKRCRDIIDQIEKQE